jgi:hypothetical protein
MAGVHGSKTYVSINGADLSTYTNNSDLTRGADSHDVTGYGSDDHVFQGGLKKGSASMEGTYDSTAGTGPRAVLRPLYGTVVPFVRRPEGTGVGKPQDACNVLVEEYVETAPVADMIKWSVKLTVSGPITSTTQ